MGKKREPKFCADFGGTTDDLQPCEKPATDGPCKGCEPSRLTVDQKKQVVMTLYASGHHSLSSAAKRVGIARETVWRWRKADPEFGAAITALKDQIDEIRLDMVEDSVFSQIIRNEAAATVVVFWMINTARRIAQKTDAKPRWINLRKVEQAEVPIKLEDLTDEELQRVAQGDNLIAVASDSIRAVRAEASANAA